VLTKGWFDFAHFQKNFSIGYGARESRAASCPYWGNGFARFGLRRSANLRTTRTRARVWGGCPRRERVTRGRSPSWGERVPACRHDCAHGGGAPSLGMSLSRHAARWGDRLCAGGAASYARTRAHARERGEAPPF
jgi:hypothetical protein